MTMERCIRYATAYTATGLTANSATPTRSAAVRDRTKCGWASNSSGKRVCASSSRKKAYSAATVPKCRAMFTKRCLPQPSPNSSCTQTKLPYDNMRCLNSVRPP